MPRSFPKGGIPAEVRWGRPPGLLAGRPRPLLLRIHRLGIEKRPTRGSAADVGVRPTIYADARKWENYAALSVSERSTFPKTFTHPPPHLRPAGGRNCCIMKPNIEAAGQDYHGDLQDPILARSSVPGEGRRRPGRSQSPDARPLYGARGPHGHAARACRAPTISWRSGTGATRRNATARRRRSPRPSWRNLRPERIGNACHQRTHHQRARGRIALRLRREASAFACPRPV